MAKSKARKLPHCFELDDLRGAGYIGLIHAAENYQPSRGVPFEKYARRRINDAISDSTRRRNWRDATQEELEAEALGGIPDPNADLDRIVEIGERRRDVGQAVASLEPRERAVVHLLFMAGQSTGEAGTALGVHASRVSQIKTCAVRRLRRHFALRGRRAA